MLSPTKLGLACETYLVREGVRLKLSKGKLEASVLSVVESYLDSNRSVRRRSRVGIRHGPKSV